MKKGVVGCGELKGGSGGGGVHAGDEDLAGFGGEVMAVSVFVAVPVAWWRKR